MRGIVVLILFLVISAVSVLFFSQNDQVVSLRYFVGQIDVPLAFIMVAAIVVGYLLGVVSLMGSLLKARFLLNQSKKKLEQNSQELNNLRSAPVRDDF